MTNFKKMKMRINNPEHSKAVQECLFEQGYYWAGCPQESVNMPEAKYLYTGTLEDGQLAWSGSEPYFRENPFEEIDVQHLDPHLYSVHKSSCVPAKSFTEKPKMKSHVIKSEFEKLSEQLKHLDKAIDAHENKQNKRKLDRERIVEKMNRMLPKGYAMVKEDDVENHPTFDPNEIVEGSVWECIKEDGNSVHRDCTRGKTYTVVAVGNVSVGFYDDSGDGVEMIKENFLNYFKRVS